METIALLLGIALALIVVLGAIASIPLNVTAGKDTYAYANTGTEGTPVWSETDNIQDVKLGDAITQYGLKLRSNRPFESNLPTLQAWNPTFKIPNIAADPLLIALIAAKNNSTAIDMAFLWGVVAPGAGINTQGMRANWTVEKMDESQDAAEADMFDVSLKIAQTGNAPTWMNITGS
jgi:hypothetical protein